MLEDRQSFTDSVCNFSPCILIHLAAQAGVRYSLENPSAYIDSNVVGTMNLLEIARTVEVEHLLLASTSSVYGANERMPFLESDATDTQLTIYAATKKANESMSHAYAHLWGIPTTVCRFFSVYGPWGRPDMALFKFVDAILSGQEIELYTEGDMSRDFTYVDDVVNAVRLLLSKIPEKPDERRDLIKGDSLSSIAPWRVVNVGNGAKIGLIEFVNSIERSLKIPAKKRFLPMQAGDVVGTLSNTDLLQSLTGYVSETSVEIGVAKFVSWYREYYKK